MMTMHWWIFTACKRSLRRLCFLRCLSVHGGRGSLLSRGGGLCYSGGWSLSRGISVQGGCLSRVVSVRGVVSVQGGLCPGGSLSRGSLSQGGPGGSLSRETPRRTVRILLECILVQKWSQLLNSAR